MEIKELHLVYVSLVLVTFVIYSCSFNSDKRKFSYEQWTIQTKNFISDNCRASFLPVVSKDGDTLSILHYGKSYSSFKQLLNSYLNERSRIHKQIPPNVDYIFEQYVQNRIVVTFQDEDKRISSVFIRPDTVIIGRKEDFSRGSNGSFNMSDFDQPCEELYLGTPRSVLIFSKYNEERKEMITYHVGME